MPNPKAQVVILSEKEQQGLEKLVKQHQTAQQIALRARIVLASAEGKPSIRIAEENQVRHDTYGSGGIVGSSCKISHWMT
jgi:hypothetical protein